MTDDMKKQLDLLKDLLSPRVNDVYGARVSRSTDGDMEDFNDQARPPPRIDHRREMVKIFNSLSYRHDKWRVFSDACEAIAITFSNAVDPRKFEKREARYHEIHKTYSKDEFNEFPKILAHLVEAMEAEPSDILGSVYHELELQNKWAGQFFTPWPVARMMAQMTLAPREEIETIIKERGFVTAWEPAAGSGVMIMALAEEMRTMGINYQQHLHATLVDIDAKCVHMAYAQLTLMHIPAVVVHGDTLSLEKSDHWYTPAHIMGGWNWKLRRRFDDAAAHTIETIPTPEALPPTDDITTEQVIEQAQKEKPAGPAEQLKLF